MKANTKLRILPLSYLEKIGRYNPRIHGSQWPGYPKSMIAELKAIAERGEKVSFIENSDPPPSIKAYYKHKKFICVEVESSENYWVMPSNWVVKV